MLMMMIMMMLVLLLSFRRKPSCSPLSGDKRLIKLAIDSDQHFFTLEMSSKDSKVGKDSAPSTLYRLLREMEEEGLVQVGLQNHDVARKSGSVAEAADDGFDVKPTDGKDMLLKYSLPNTSARAVLGQHNIANLFEASQSCSQLPRDAGCEP